MERAAFLVEQTGVRIPCLLNPESMVVRRRAGVTPRQAGQGPLVIGDRANGPLVFSGGGCTEVTLNLLFDTGLPTPSPLPVDVRAMTEGLWQAARGVSGGARGGSPPAVRFFWGKWNMLGAISALAERLEYFTPDGVPRRSWLRLRLLELAEQPAGGPEGRVAVPHGHGNAAPIPSTPPGSVPGAGPAAGTAPAAQAAAPDFLGDLLDADTLSLFGGGFGGRPWT